MKTIEEKAKRYDEAIEKAKIWHIDCQIDFKKSLELLFPELEESKDERIRKTLISHFCGIRDNCGKDWYGFNINDVIAWLEKQGEQKSQGKSALEAIQEEKVDNQNCVKPADKVEPKFKVGDWVVRNGKTLQISGIDTVLDGTFHYWFTKGTWLSSKDMENAMLWTIQDAKDGDVLADGDVIVLFKSIGNEDSNIVIDYYAYTSSVSMEFVTQKEGYYWGDTQDCTLTPATKEQCDLLFQNMKESGYKWDAEKKELKKIGQKAAEWSEEDEDMFKSIIATCELAEQDRDSSPAKHLLEMQTNWLKSLKDRVHPKQEWSEGDEKIRRVLVKLFEISEDEQTWCETDITTKDILTYLEKQGNINKDNKVNLMFNDTFIEKALAWLDYNFYYNNLQASVVSTKFNCMEEMFENFKTEMA